MDGQSVVVNNGLHGTTDVTGTIRLSAGAHVVSFKYFERTGLAAAGYSVRMPDSAGFSILPDAFDAFRLGSIFDTGGELQIGAILRSLRRKIGEAPYNPRHRCSSY